MWTFTVPLMIFFDFRWCNLQNNFRNTKVWTIWTSFLDILALSFACPFFVLYKDFRSQFLWEFLFSRCLFCLQLSNVPLGAVMFDQLIQSWRFSFHRFLAFTWRFCRNNCFTNTGFCLSNCIKINYSFPKRTPDAWKHFH